MRISTIPLSARPSAFRQRGVVLFFALMALLAMSLAAVALIRSVDTGTIIAGNLALKQSATTSSDAGVEEAIIWLSTISATNAALEVINDPTHPLNQDAPTSGYYSSFDPDINPLDPNDIGWDSNDSAAVNPDGDGNATPDASGNRSRYIIQRMCRTPNVAIKDASCLFSAIKASKSGQQVLLPQDICFGPGCPAEGQTPRIRITVQTTGARNTVSYVQAYVY